MADEPSIAEEILLAVLARMIRTGALSEDDIEAISADLDAKAQDAAGADRDRLEEAAHQFNCTVLDAHTPTKAEWKAERARARLRVIDGKPGD